MLADFQPLRSLNACQVNLAGATVPARGDDPPEPPAAEAGAALAAVAPRAVSSAAVAAVIRAGNLSVNFMFVLRQGDGGIRQNEHEIKFGSMCLCFCD
jgi:hypothetical protein